MAKSRQKSYTLNCSHKCPCTFPHSYAFSTGYGTKNKIKATVDPKNTLKINIRSHWTIFQIFLMSAVICNKKILHGSEIKQYLENYKSQLVLK